MTTSRPWMTSISSPVFARVRLICICRGGTGLRPVPNAVVGVIANPAIAQSIRFAVFLL